MNRVFLSLGSNINKEINLPEAVHLLRTMCQVVAVAFVYETAPVGLEKQPPFWNTAVLILTDQNACEVKRTIISVIEQKLKRQRTDDKNAPRSIDIDIALFNADVFTYDPGDGRLRQIPDPDLLKFPHAAVPIAELAPDMPHPVTGQPLATIAAQLMAAHTRNGRLPIQKISRVKLKPL